MAPADQRDATSFPQAKRSFEENAEKSSLERAQRAIEAIAHVKIIHERERGGGGGGGGERVK